MMTLTGVVTKEMDNLEMGNLGELITQARKRVFQHSQ